MSLDLCFHPGIVNTGHGNLGRVLVKRGSKYWIVV